MARINIEDSLTSDMRFINLAIRLGSMKLALGELVWAWKVSQKFYLTTVNDRCIPFDEWAKQECSDAIIEVGLAEKREKGIWLSGADKQFGWLEQRQKAGTKSGESRKNNKKTELERPLTTVNDRQRGPTGVEPLYSLLSSLSSSSRRETCCEFFEDGSIADKKAEESPRDENGGLPSEPPKKPSRVQAESKQTQKHPSNPSTSKQEPNTAKLSQASPSLSPSNSSSSRRTAAAFSENGKFGAIEPFASSKVLQAPLKKVPKELQKLWIDQWGDTGWVLKTLEKAFAKRLAAGAGDSEDWGSTFTSWLWRERDKPKQQIPEVTTGPTYAISQEQAWDVFQSQLRARGVESLVKLLPSSREAH